MIHEGGVGLVNPSSIQTSSTDPYSSFVVKSFLRPAILPTPIQVYLS